MDPFRGADKKLGELMLRSWTMLAESCSVPSCQCPLMRSPDGQKYCVNCEEWIYDNKKREQKKFNELFPSMNNQLKQQKKEIPQKIVKSKDVEKKEIIQEGDIKVQKEEKKISTKISNIKNNSNESFTKLLEDKLVSLGNDLNNETDIKKCQDIIELMNKIIEVIENYKKIK